MRCLRNCIFMVEDNCQWDVGAKHPIACRFRISNSEHAAKPPYSGVSVERVVSRRACANGVNAETEGNAPISREAPQARAANT